jgi:hypothetical protein
LGTGTGKPIFAALFAFPFKKVVGLELLNNLIILAK